MHPLIATIATLVLFVAPGLLFVAVLAFQEYRIAVLRDRVEQADERATHLLELFLPSPEKAPTGAEDPGS